jgi:hypothetical protein
VIYTLFPRLQQWGVCLPPPIVPYVSISDLACKGFFVFYFSPYITCAAWVTKLSPRVYEEIANLSCFHNILCVPNVNQEPIHTYRINQRSGAAAPLLYNIYTVCHWQDERAHSPSGDTFFSLFVQAPREQPLKKNEIKARISWMWLLFQVHWYGERGEHWGRCSASWAIVQCHLEFNTLAASCTLQIVDTSWDRIWYTVAAILKNNKQ